MNLIVFLIFCLIQSIFAEDLLFSKLKQTSGIFKDSSKQIPNTVLLVGCNYGFLNHLYNFRCFADRLGMKFLVIAMDTKLHEHLSQTSLMESYQMTGGVVGEVSSESSDFRSKQFNLITAKKKEAVHNVLKLGYDVLFADTDVIMLRNPLPFLRWENVDYVHSLNVNCKSQETWTFGNGNKEEGNTGFYFVKSNNQTIRLWETAYEASLRTPRLDDQAVFWSVIRRTSDPPITPLDRCKDYQQQPSDHTLVTCALDSCVFSSGMLSGIYEPEFTYPELMKNLAVRNETPCTIHANYIKGNHVKMQILKQHGLWLAEIPKEGEQWSGRCLELSSVNQ